MDSVVEWIIDGTTPIKTSNKARLNEEIGLFLTVSAKEDLNNANLQYNVTLKLPDGELTDSEQFILVSGSLEKGMVYPMQGQMSAVMADDPADCGAYQFLIDLLDNGKPMGRIIMDFDIVP